MNDQRFHSRRPRIQLLPLALLFATGMLPVLFPGMSVAQSSYATVILDPGHGGSQPGAVHGRVAEKSVNLSLALAVEHYLHNYGINTAITRDRDLTMSLEKRARYASYFQKPLFVSLHYNAAPRASAHGIETFYYSKESRTLAALVQNALVRSTHAHDRGVRHRGFHVLRKNVAPVSILVEGGFLTNIRERAKVAHPSYRDVQARAIASAIAMFMGRSQAPQRSTHPSLLVGLRPQQQMTPKLGTIRRHLTPPSQQLVLAALPAAARPTTRPKDPRQFSLAQRRPAQRR